MIFVTGGTGLLGSHLLFELAGKGEKVRALFRTESRKAEVLKTFGYYSNDPQALFDTIEWVKGDTLDYLSLAQAMKGLSLVYHVAGFVSFSGEDREKMMQVNIQGTANVVNAALEAGIDKLCYVSSIAAVGPSENGDPACEEDQWKPAKDNSAYSVSKYYAEMEVWRGIVEGLNAVIVNPSIILGPGNWGKGSSSIFPAVYNGMKFYSPGVTAYVDVRDVVKSMVLLMNSDISGQRFIVSAENLGYKDLFSMIATNFNKPLPLYKATKFILQAAWRLDWLRSKLFFGKQFLSKEMARSAVKKVYVSNVKIKEAMGMDFLPLTQTIRDICRIYMNELTAS